MNKSSLITIFSIPSIIVIIFLLVFSTNKQSDTLQTADNVNQNLQSSNVDQSNKVLGESNMNNMPEMTIDESKKYQALINTDQGVITVDLFADKTPITVNNFVHLSNTNFYNNTIFHRVIEGFMIQGGDPTGTGSGGPGYKFDDEPFEGEYTAGTIAMANAGPNTNGSQFFIMHKDNPLPKNYVIFGNVSDGMEVVDKIATADVSMSAMGENSKPISPVSIKSIEILEY